MFANIAIWEWCFHVLMVSGSCKWILDVQAGRVALSSVTKHVILELISYVDIMFMPNLIYGSVGQIKAKCQNRNDPE